MADIGKHLVGALVILVLLLQAGGVVADNSRSSPAGIMHHQQSQPQEPSKIDSGVAQSSYHSPRY